MKPKEDNVNEVFEAYRKSAWVYAILLISSAVGILVVYAGPLLGTNMYTLTGLVSFGFLPPFVVASIRGGKGKLLLGILAVSATFFVASFAVSYM